MSLLPLSVPVSALQPASLTPGAPSPRSVAIPAVDADFNGNPGRFLQGNSDDFLSPNRILKEVDSFSQGFSPIKSSTLLPTVGNSLSTHATAKNVLKGTQSAINKILAPDFASALLPQSAPSIGDIGPAGVFSSDIGGLSGFPPAGALTPDVGTFATALPGASALAPNLLTGNTLNTFPVSDPLSNGLFSTPSFSPAGSLGSLPGSSPFLAAPTNALIQTPGNTQANGFSLLRKTPSPALIRDLSNFNPLIWTNPSPTNVMFGTMDVESKIFGGNGIFSPPSFNNYPLFPFISRPPTPFNGFNIPIPNSNGIRTLPNAQLFPTVFLTDSPFFILRTPPFAVSITQAITSFPSVFGLIKSLWSPNGVPPWI